MLEAPSPSGFQVPKKPKERMDVALRRDMEQIPGAVALAGKRVRRGTLAKFQEKVLLAYTPAMLTSAMTMLLRKAREGDLSAVRMCLELHGYIQKGGNGINNNILIQQQAIATPVVAGDYDFDASVRRLYDQRAKATTIEMAPAMQAIEQHPGDE